MNKIVALGIVGLLLMGTGSCLKRDDQEVISFEKREEVKNENNRPEPKAIRIAIGGMITPKEGYVYYKQLLDYLEEQLGTPMVIVDRKDYTEINALVKSSAIDIAFVCGGPYVDAIRSSE